MNLKYLGMMVQFKQLPKRKSQRALMHLRLYPLEARVYRNNEGIWAASVPTALNGMIEAVHGGDEDVIMRLIVQGVLVPDIVSNKEYKVQRAVGSVDYRMYHLHSKIAAKYQFSYDISRILSRIENSIDLCDYNIFEEVDVWGQQVDGQKFLEIIPREGTVTYDYLNNPIANPSRLGDVHYVDQTSFDNMISRGIIVVKDTKWKLSRNYWEFHL